MDDSVVIIMMSGHKSIASAVEAIQLGAYDWLEKPLEKDRLLLTVRNAMEKSLLRREKSVLLREAKADAGKTASGGDDVALIQGHLAKLAEKAAQFQGEDGLVALYALAKHGDPNQRIAAVQAAVQRKQEGLPVLAAAFKCKEPEVRTAVVRAAKAIGGDLVEQGIQMALQDPDASLREAAEKALRDAAAKK